MLKDQKRTDVSLLELHMGDISLVRSASKQGNLVLVLFLG